MKISNSFKTDLNPSNSVFGLVVLTALFTVVLSGCGGSGTPSDSTSEGYVSQSYLLRNIDLNNAASKVSFRLDDTLIPPGPVNLDTVRHDFSASSGLYSLSFSTSSGITPGAHQLSLFDGATEVVAIQQSMPGDPAVAVSDPANRLYLSGQGSVICSVTVTTGVTGGYIIAMVKADEAYTNTGFAEIVVGNSATILPDEFFFPGTNVLDTGVYYIYVYAFNGAPFIDSINDDLPTQISSLDSLVLSDN
ncbi:MAG: hypothetical protein IIB00_05925, partial [candidate division Zixibacteria bacterium]|nr:hypothetical protein [candidate division Zixibacteria bacterium]